MRIEQQQGYSRRLEDNAEEKFVNDDENGTDGDVGESETRQKEKKRRWVILSLKSFRVQALSLFHWVWSFPFSGFFILFLSVYISTHLLFPTRPSHRRSLRQIYPQFPLFFTFHISPFFFLSFSSLSLSRFVSLYSPALSFLFFVFCSLSLSSHDSNLVNSVYGRFLL